MATKIRLKRMGKKFYAFYRVVIMDSRTKRDGRAIEEIGTYNPNTQPSTININSERAQYWLGVGAQPTEQVLNLLKITGDWQKFKGLPGSEGTLQVAPPKVNKLSVYEAAVAEAANEPKLVKKPKLETPVEVVAEVVAAEVVAQEAVAEAVAEAVVEAEVAETTAEVVAEEVAAEETSA